MYCRHAWRALGVNGWEISGGVLFGLVGHAVLLPAIRMHTPVGILATFTFLPLLANAAKYAMTRERADELKSTAISRPINRGPMEATPSFETHYAIREDLRSCHEVVWEHIARPGTWWSARDRGAIAQEARNARTCTLCAQRKQAMSPFAVNGDHDSTGELAPEVEDVVHRVITDPGRLTRSFVEGLFEGVLDEARYVELVSVCVLTHAMDVFSRALGAPSAPLPGPRPGEPTHRASRFARDDGAWVKLLPAGDEGGEEARALYQDAEVVPNISRALSLVPAEAAVMLRVAASHYLEASKVRDPSHVPRGRALDRMQMELVASRVSILNDCFY
jgi:hypothetical protein